MNNEKTRRIRYDLKKDIDSSIFDFKNKTTKRNLKCFGLSEEFLLWCEANGISRRRVAWCTDREPKGRNRIQERIGKHQTYLSVKCTPFQEFLLLQRWGTE